MMLKNNIQGNVITLTVFDISLILSDMEKIFFYFAISFVNSR